MSDQLATKEVPCPCCHGEKELPVYDPGGKNLIGKVLCCHCEGEGAIYAEPEFTAEAEPPPGGWRPIPTEFNINDRRYTEAYLENAKGEMWTKGLTRGVEIGYEKARAEHPLTQADVDQAYTNGLLKGVQRGWYSRGSHDRYQPKKSNGAGPNGGGLDFSDVNLATASRSTKKPVRHVGLSAAQYKDLCNSYRVQLTNGRAATTSPVTNGQKKPRLSKFQREAIQNIIDKNAKFNTKFKPKAGRWVRIRKRKAKALRNFSRTPARLPRKKSVTKIWTGDQIVTSAKPRVPKGRVTKPQET